MFKVRTATALITCNKIAGIQVTGVDPVLKEAGIKF